MVWVSTWTVASAQSTSSPSIQIFSVGVRGMAQSLSAMASPMAAVDSVGSGWEWMKSATAWVTFSAAEASPRKSSMRAAERMAAAGLALPVPAMSWAAPWTGSNSDGPGAVGVEVGRGGVADAPGHRAGQVGDDVAEQVVGDDHVVAVGVLHQVDAGGVDVVVVAGAPSGSRPPPRRPCAATGRRRRSARWSCAPGSGGGGAGSRPGRRRSGRTAPRRAGC